MFDVLAGAGRDAAEIERLFRVMAAGAVVIWLMVTALALHAMRLRRSPWTDRASIRLIVIGGCVVPTVVLAALLAFGMPALAGRRVARDAGVRISVVGEQWWWRVRYQSPGRSPVELANEIRLPRGDTAEIMLTSSNVIHSFWIPALAGKVDMIPGRVTRLTVTPTRTGVYRGVCAEYCGASHTRMAFVAEVMEPEAFARWLESESQPALPAGGERLFMASGCAACHAIRGTAAGATIGPDLTHVGRRHGIAAGAVINHAAAIAQWIARPDRSKPGVLMPPFDALPFDQRLQLAEYLRSLQ